jgi:molybdate transport system substrate-binding protein
VSVAVSLRPALIEAGNRYTPLTVVLNSGGSVVLLHQVLRGAPADLLISASPSEIDRLMTEELALPKTRRKIAGNRLVLVVPAGHEAPSSVEDLLQPAFALIAVGNPRTAPLGRYTRQALMQLDLWNRLEPRLIPGENARATLEYVARGEVDAGIVYRTDAALLKERVRLGPSFPATLDATVLYEGIVLADSDRPDDAVAFLEWLATGPGQDVLTAHGFARP